MCKVSVIIPVYNVAPYLRQCLDSVVNQSLRDIEIICVDDCSTDMSLEILKEYAGKDSRFIILENSENLHAGISRNKGLETARGEYVLFLDGDDWLADNGLERIYALAKSKNADVLRCTALDYDNESGQIAKSEFDYLKNVPSFLFNKVIKYTWFPRIFSKVNVAPWGGIYKRDFLSENNICFDSLICCNDRPFYCKSILSAQRVMFVKDSLVYYRINNGTSLIGGRIRNFDCNLQSYRIIFSQTASLPRHLRRLYLNGEMFDIAHWLEKSAGTEYENEIKAKVTAFLKDMDKSPWNGSVDGEKWRRRMERALIS